MEKLRILLLVLWCSVLVMPVQASGVLSAAPSPAAQQVSDQDADIVPVLAAAAMPAESKAVLQLDRDQLLPVLQELTQQLYGTTIAIQPLSVGAAFILKANGLHTTLTAGP